MASFPKVISPFGPEVFACECCRQLLSEQLTSLEENLADEISGTLKERFTICALRAMNLDFWLLGFILYYIAQK